jgi:hypothetical protein
LISVIVAEERRELGVQHVRLDGEIQTPVAPQGREAFRRRVTPQKLSRRRPAASLAHHLQEPRRVVTERPAKGPVVDAVEPEIREYLTLDPTIPAAVIAERIGWDRSITVFRERVAELRPVYLPQDPAGRTEYEPGHRAQNDFWFPEIEIPVGHGTVASGKSVPPVLVMASGYSRWMLGLMIPSRHAEDLVLGTWQLLRQLGGVPRQMVWDNEGGVGKYQGKGRPPRLSRQFAEFRGLLGCEVVVLPPREPEHKPRAAYCTSSGRLVCG